MEKRFLRFPTVKRTALYAETYVSHMKNVRFRCRKRRTNKENCKQRKLQETVYRFPCFDAEYTLIAAARAYLKQEKHKKSP